MVDIRAASLVLMQVIHEVFGDRLSQLSKALPDPQPFGKEMTRLKRRINLQFEFDLEIYHSLNKFYHGDGYLSNVKSQK